MATDSFKVKKSLNIEPIAGAAPTTEGDVTYDLTAHKASIYNGTSASPLVTEAHSATLINKSIDADTNTITNIENADIKAAAAIAVNKLAATTASRALVSDSSGFLSAATTTATEIGYVNGVTSAIQTQFTGKAAAKNLGLACSVGSSALTIALKQADGSTDPSTGSAAVSIDMRSSTLTSGAVVTRTATAATSLVISSGSTLGHASATAHYIYVYLIDNSGTLELAASTTLFDTTGVVSTTAEGGAGAADSNAVMYSTTARSNVAARCIARLTVTEATAGTWATAPAVVDIREYTEDPIACEIYTSAAQTSLNNTDVTVQYNTKTKDSHNAFNTSTYTFTAPATRSYRIEARARFSSITATTSYGRLRILVGGVNKAETFTYTPSDEFTLVTPKTIDLTVGDTVTITGGSNDASFGVGGNGNIHEALTIVSIPRSS